MSVERDIFRHASTTYYWSSVFFPASVRDDVFKLYSFVRVVDDLVDQVPQEVGMFKLVQKSWHDGKPDPRLGELEKRALCNMLELQRRYEMPVEWVVSFLRSMQFDTTARQYSTLDDSLDYVYGSADVIGLMMATVLGLSPDSHHGAQMQGRAMQWINFCRDIAEDLRLGRQYFPREDLDKFGLVSLDESEARSNPEAFSAFMHFQLGRYSDWQAQADAAHTYVPKRTRIPVETAATMYGWTARRIAEDPFVVYRRKVKPSKQRVMLTAAGFMTRL